jgi:hypothetical protein
MSLTLRTSLTVLASALALALGLPASAAAGLDGGEGKWVPGSVLIKFGTPDRNTIDLFVRRSMGGQVIRKLPIIPNAYEVEVDGDLERAIAHGLTVSDEERGQGPEIQWAQPNYYVHLNYFSSPTDKAYYPNDPRYWPFAASNPNSCPGPQSAQGQSGLWPWYGDLANSLGVWNQANPLQASQRLPDTSQYNVGLSGAASSSIDVLPAWNALADSLPGGQPTDGKTGPTVGLSKTWSSDDLARSGIAVWDSGLSNAPDLSQQVAALFSVGTKRSDPPTERWYDVYSDNRARFDEEFQALRGELRGVDYHSDYRIALLPIDDLGSGALGAAEHLPTGCDGHGTEVASVAAATTGNAKGVAGVAWNVPVVGIRPNVPVLDTDTKFDPELFQQQKPLLDRAEKATRVDLSDGSMIDALQIVKGLRLPVLNMSWGSQLFESERAKGDNEVVVKSPGVVEAMGRVLTDGTTLGVAAAGPGRYGFGRSATSAVTERGAADAAQLPCALRDLAAYHVKLVTLGLHPFDPGVRWNNANLICATGTYADSSALIPKAGSGDAAVDLAAPGVATVATRPTGGGLNPDETYRLATGTSFSAAMVSGAAALLRELAPRAKPQFIAAALRAGARPNVQLARTVRYGELDVACSALWLAQRGANHPDWGVRVPVQALEVPQTKHCFQSSTGIYQYTWSLPKSYFDAGATTVGGDGFSRADFSRGALATRIVEEAFADKNDLAKARGIQTQVLGPESTWKPGETAFFPIKSGPRLLANPVAPPRRFAYNFQGQPVVCPAGTRVAGFGLKWKDLIHPSGYIWFSPKASLSSTTFMVALVKPWYTFALPAEMRIEVTVRCVRPPPGSEP